mmetsp:Transcript_20265/g.30106  ORF Transcript_20265/g.30106 Transcript_20265/m.30106 type:complete len:288 (-) Transcript_20265:29-892(-)
MIFEAPFTYVHPVYDSVLFFGGLLGLFITVAAQYLPSPYGKLTDPKAFENASTLEKLLVHPAIPRLSSGLGWMLMELPATLSYNFYFWWCFIDSQTFPNTTQWVLYAMWTLHYANRGFIQPLKMRSSPGSFSLIVVLVGWPVTWTHGYLHAAFVACYAPHIGGDENWLLSSQFLIGISLYYGSLATNIYLDGIIRQLRSVDEAKKKKRVYRIPHGSLFEYCTNPQYFTELTGWFGFFILHWNLGTLFVFVVSCANLIPRSISQHRWYHSYFKDKYPKNRKILIPFIW